MGGSLLNSQATDAAVREVVERLKQAGMSTTPDGKLTWPSAERQERLFAEFADPF